MLKTSEDTESKIWPGEGRVEVGGSRAGQGGNKLDDGRRVDGNEVRDDEIGTKVQKLSKSKKTESGFLISKARKTFMKLRQVFIKALILHHFDPERHIRVKTDVSGYAIGGVLS